MSRPAPPPDLPATAQLLPGAPVRAAGQTGWYDPDGAAWEPDPPAHEPSIREPAVRPAIRVEHPSRSPRP
jgi:hypothetical protein